MPVRAWYSLCAHGEGVHYHSSHIILSVNTPAGSPPHRAVSVSVIVASMPPCDSTVTLAMRES